MLQWYAALLALGAVWQGSTFVAEVAGDPPNPSAPAFQATVTALCAVMCAVTALVGRLAARPVPRGGGAPPLPHPGQAVPRGPSPRRVLGLGLILAGVTLGAVVGILLGSQVFVTVWVGGRPDEWADVFSLLLVLYWVPVMAVAVVTGAGVWLRRPRRPGPGPSPLAASPYEGGPPGIGPAPGR